MLGQPVYGTTHHVTQCQLCLSFEMPRFARTVPTHGGASRRALREGPGSWAGRGHSVPFTGCLAEFAVINHTLPSSCLFLSSLHPSPTPSLHSPKQLIQSFPCRVGTVEGSPPAITTIGLAPLCGRQPEATPLGLTCPCLLLSPPHANEGPLGVLLPTESCDSSIFGNRCGCGSKRSLAL